MSSSPKACGGAGAAAVSTAALIVDAGAPYGAAARRDNATIVWPGVTIGVFVALFAVYCFINAIAQLFAMFTIERSAGRDVLRLVLAVIDVAAGVVAGASLVRPRAYASQNGPPYPRAWSAPVIDFLLVAATKAT